MVWPLSERGKKKYQVLEISPDGRGELVPFIPKDVPFTEILDRLASEMGERNDQRLFALQSDPRRRDPVARLGELPSWLTSGLSELTGTRDAAQHILDEDYGQAADALFWGALDTGLVATPAIRLGSKFLPSALQSLDDVMMKEAGRLGKKYAAPATAGALTALSAPAEAEASKVKLVEGFFSQLGRYLKDMPFKRGSKEELQKLLDSQVRKGVINREEVDRTVDMLPVDKEVVTRTDVRNAYEHQKPFVYEWSAGGPRPTDPSASVHHGGLTKGGLPQSYREIVLSTDDAGLFSTGSGHFTHAPNDTRHIAWLRMDNREMWDGGKSTHIGELQSPRHQKGRKKGYIAPIGRDFSDEMTNLETELARAIEWYNRPGLAPSEQDAALKQLHSLTNRLHYAHEQINKDRIPDAPFKGGNWIKLGFRKALMEAAEDGSDWLTWDTADIQKSRWTGGNAHEAFEIQYDKEMPKIAKQEAKRLGLDPDLVTKHARFNREMGKVDNPIKAKVDDIRQRITGRTDFSGTSEPMIDIEDQMEVVADVIRENNPRQLANLFPNSGTPLFNVTFAAQNLSKVMDKHGGSLVEALGVEGPDNDWYGHFRYLANVFARDNHIPKTISSEPYIQEAVDAFLGDPSSALNLARRPDLEHMLFKHSDTARRGWREIRQTIKEIDDEIDVLERQENLPTAPDSAVLDEAMMQAVDDQIEAAMDAANYIIDHGTLSDIMSIPALGADTRSVWGMKLTPEAREKIKEGLPKFAVLGATLDNEE